MLPRFTVSHPAGIPRAAVLVVHGLNLHPERMQPICSLLLDHGATVVRMALRGHRGAYESLARVYRRDWLHDFAAAFRRLPETRTETGKPVPVGFLGQSLGALAFCDFLCTARSDPALGGGAPPVSEALLLSPAIAVRPRVHALRPLIALHRHLPIPSASDPADRLYDRLPAGAYRALFASYESFRRSVAAQPLNLPCSLVVNEADELVSPRGLSRLVESGSLARARMMILQRSADGRGAHHLAVDPDTMGAVNWQRFCTEVGRFVEALAGAPQRV